MSQRADDKLTKRLQAAKRKILRGADDISDKRACEMFSLLVSDNGRRRGRRGPPVPGCANGEFTVGGQRCGEGVHTEFTYEEAGLCRLHSAE